MSITVIGAGLSGLSSAFHLSRRFPNSRIVVLERQAKLGGWVNSTRTNQVLLEGGPRTLRPNGKSVLELINLLNLQDQLVTVQKSAPAAKARYLYIPPSSSSPFALQGLQKIPATPKEFLTSPLTRLLIPSILREAFTTSNRPKGATDESFDALFSRRFGAEFARIFGSALVHGIYASDSRKLSVKSAFPSIWQLEDAGRGSITRGAVKEMLFKSKPKPEDEYNLGDLPKLMQGVSVYSFKNGMQTLTDALHAALVRQPNVTIIPNAPVNSISKIQPDTFQITHSGSQTHYTTHLVSSIPPQSLKHILRPSPYLSLPPHTTPLMLANPQSSVQVVNLVFPCAPKHIHPQGFGYLVPRPLEDYSSWTTKHKHGVLGMVFDSCSLHAQDAGGDNMTPEEYYDNGKWTKVTVMLGGPYGFPSSGSALSDGTGDVLPRELEGLLDTLSVHLGRPLPKPVQWKVWNNYECIPTLLPGHLERVEELRRCVEGRGKGKERTGITLVGAGVDGVSVPDVVKSGRRAAYAL
ncbi:hypothetical protein CVT24_009301 [Panaeolus cyanescens]|uniref:Protoporphyrinogen oxidase n=1 Tax=Panaeolus cyanescens TaxID=181874 RepID=A0A409Y864_9AGAR|nr:hypothetical protein CVT24_009301 [Panaeolus cyanescens]